jgi:hypothetical protein
VSFLIPSSTTRRWSGARCDAADAAALMGPGALRHHRRGGA